MRDLLSYTLFSLSLFILTPSAFAYDYPPPPPSEQEFEFPGGDCSCEYSDSLPLFAIESELEDRCQDTHSACPIEALECRIQALQDLQEECLLTESEFRRLFREAELELAYNIGYRDGKSEAVCAPTDPDDEINPGEPDQGDEDDSEDLPEDDSSEKIEICHIPPGNPENAHTIEVSVNAWPAHEAHGDTLGACEDSSTEVVQDPADESSANLATKRGEKKKKGKKKRKNRK